jgi:hypothetical protein
MGLKMPISPLCRGNNSYPTQAGQKGIGLRKIRLKEGFLFQSNGLSVRYIGTIFYLRGVFKWKYSPIPVCRESNGLILSSLL